MTYADQDFIPVEQEETPNYPTAFGITFTPRVSGVVFAVLGLLGATYLLVNAVQPAWLRYQELDASVKAKQDQIANQQNIQRQIKQKEQELAQARQENRQVLSLFANEKSLNTLLLDLNSFVKDRKGTLLRYEPTGAESETVVNDGSLGPAVDGKLKRTSRTVELEGSFDQVQSILRSFERLQSLLLIKDLKAEISEPQPLKLEGGRAVLGERPTIKTTFKLEALSPVTSEQPQENAKPAPAPAQTPAATPSPQ
mgnify:CR=1 FL=1